jgi:hypothetical protein
LSIHDVASSDTSIHDKLNKPFLAYVGAWEGCGCGFEHGLLEDPDEQDLREDELGRESVRELRSLLESLLEHDETVQLYVCMDGEQDLHPQNHVDVTPAFFAGDSLELEPRTLFIVRPAA